MEYIMEFSEAAFCNTVCTRSNKSACNWAKWDNPYDHQFPDGTFQTCVGAQVRCGCTTTMNIISYITYEHPTAVVILFLFLATLLLFFTIKCIVVDYYCGLACCVCDAVDNKREVCSPSARVSEASLDELFATRTNARDNEHKRNSVQVYYVEMEKPPSYAHVMMQEIGTLPPSYADSMQNQKAGTT